MNKKRKSIQNIKKPIPNVRNAKSAAKAQLVIDFTAYNNWENSCKINNIRFTNHYKDKKHIQRTLGDILFKLFPFIQSNFSSILSGQEAHCHIVDSDKIEFVWKIIDEVHKNNKIDREVDIYQMGVTGATRVFGSLVTRADQYVFYPLFIDCNHLVYSSVKHNVSDFKKYKVKI